MAFPWCVLLARPPGSRGVFQPDARWEPSDGAISIGFLDGDAGLQARVRGAAGAWLARTGIPLAFDWRDHPRGADIRISFSHAGSWSALGARARDIPQGDPTMCFGFLTPAATDVQVREVVLHEFGHALGLVHEHLSPLAAIPWDRDAVIAELSAPPNCWDLETIEANVLRGVDRATVIATPFDPASIMLYPVTSRWTAGRYETTNNTDLSEQDIALVRAIYLR